MAAKKNEKAAMATAAELRDMSVEELRAKLAEQREELMTARFKHATAQLEKTSELKAMRRQVVSKCSHRHFCMSPDNICLWLLGFYL